MRRRAHSVILASITLTIVLGYYAATNLGVNTDTGSMISEQVPWRRAFLQFAEAFPQYGNEIQVVIDGPTPELTDRVQRELSRRMRGEETVYAKVYAPGASDFFDRHALLFLDIGDLQRLKDGIARYAWWLPRLERYPTLDGLVDALEEAVHLRTNRVGTETEPLLNLASLVLNEHLTGRHRQISWQEAIGGRQTTVEERRRYIIALPRFDFEKRLPAGPAIRRVRELSAELDLERSGARVRVTGSTAIKHDSIESAMEGTAYAGFLALLLVSIVLYCGLGSIRLTIASLATLIAGLAGTAAFAAVAVGHLNLISIAFAVLYVGLGIDYAVHVILGYREALESGDPHAEALRVAAQRVGSSIFLSAVTTAACFFAFIPTRFTGVSELGIISGTGMLISLLVTMTVLPAMLTVLGPGIAKETAANSTGHATLGHFGQWAGTNLQHHRNAVAGSSVVLVGLGLLLAPRVRFEHRPIDLTDPSSESVTTYHDLVESGNTAPLAVSVLAPTDAAAQRLADIIEQLSVVREAVTLRDFVPDDQDEKFVLISEIDSLLAPLSSLSIEASGAAAWPNHTVSEALSALARLEQVLNDVYWAADAQSAGTVKQLRVLLRRWQRNADDWPPESRDRLALSVETDLLGALPDRMAALRLALRPGQVTVDNLPAELVEWWVSDDGVHRVQAISRDPLTTAERVSRFVDAVRTVASDATGIPVSDLESTRVALAAFRTAFVYALIATTLLLYFLFGDLRSVGLVVAPLLLAALLTVATAAIADIPFNFANLITLPLLLGVGVDNGIHMVHRSHAIHGIPGGPVATSTGRAVLFASLTTIVSFCSLAFSDHRGIASMGQLLTIGMLSVLLCTLVVLPALVAFGDQRPLPR